MADAPIVRLLDHEADAGYLLEWRKRDGEWEARSPGSTSPSSATEAACRSTRLGSPAERRMTADGRVLLFIIIAFTFIAVGRHFQRTVYAWRLWKDTVARLLDLKTGAWASVRLMIKVAIFAAVVFWVVINLNYFVT
ncbi:hypothetical protein ACGFJC_15705 [Nonomuraea fuscirosea]|uniref:hypothetical protein n=1 Tax=Nonomuraea fuscirosea TaxID=1291556 RepID=UPI00346A05D4